MSEEPGPSNPKLIRLVLNPAVEEIEVTIKEELLNEDSDYYVSENESEESEYEAEDITPASFDNKEPIWTRSGTIKKITFTGSPGFLQPCVLSPTSYFDLLLDYTFYKNFVKQTNAYAAQHEKSNNEWKNLTLEELRKFFALVLHMGTIQIPRIHEYWKKHRLFDFSCFSRHMGRNRFFSILRYLRFTVPTTTKYDNINALVDYFNKKMTEVYHAEKELSIEEFTIPFSGKQKMYDSLQHRNSKYGIKLHVLTEPRGGLVVKMNAFVGKNHGSNLERKENIIMNLLQENLHKGHSVYMDNCCHNAFFIEKLKRNGTHYTGRLTNVERGKCKEVAEAKLMKGEVVARYYKGIVFAKWKNEREVMFISNEHDGELSVVKNSRDESMFKPNALIQYNKFMRGADKKDWMHFYLANEHKSFQWYVKFCIYVIENLIFNSYLLYSKYSTEEKMYYYDFRLNIIDYMLFEDLPVEEVVSEISHFPQKLQRAELGHIKRKRCRICSKNGIRKGTAYFCPNCPDEPGLCLDPCFRLYHTNN